MGKNNVAFSPLENSQRKYAANARRDEDHGEEQEEQEEKRNIPSMTVSFNSIHYYIYFAN